MATSALQNEQVTKKMLGGQKFVSYTEMRSVFFSGMDSSQHRASPLSFLTNRTKRLSELGQYVKNETLALPFQEMALAG